MNKKKILGGLVAAAVVAGGTILWQTTAGAQANGLSNASGYAACIAPGNKLRNDQIFPADRAPVCTDTQVLYTWPSQKAAAAAQLQINGLLTSVSSLNETASGLQDQIDALDGGKQNKFTATGVTHLAGREDGGHGNPSVWAHDDVQRTVTVSGNGPVPLSNCGVTSGQCFYVTGSVVDSGSFLTLEGAKSPHAGTPIGGTLGGAIDGTLTFEGYSTSNDVDGTRALAQATGNDISTGAWFEQLFPAGTHFAGVSTKSYDYEYAVSQTCEHWSDSDVNGDGTDADAGDITGVNHCTV